MGVRHISLVWGMSNAWLEFEELVKAFDTSNYALLIAILGKYGALPRLRSEIKRMYNKSVIKLIIGKA